MSALSIGCLLQHQDGEFWHANLGEISTQASVQEDGLCPLVHKYSLSRIIPFRIARVGNGPCAEKLAFELNGEVGAHIKRGEETIRGSGRIVVDFSHSGWVVVCSTVGVVTPFDDREVSS